MSTGFRRMAARLWPDSLFRRLAIILFAGLLAAHVLSFGLVALNVFGPSNEVSDDYFLRWVATAVAILDRVKPEERPAWADLLAGGAGLRDPRGVGPRRHGRRLQGQADGAEPPVRAEDDPVR